MTKKSSAHMKQVIDAYENQTKYLKYKIWEKPSEDGRYMFVGIGEYLAYKITTEAFERCSRAALEQQCNEAAGELIALASLRPESEGEYFANVSIDEKVKVPLSVVSADLMKQVIA